MNTKTLEARSNGVINNPKFEEFLEFWGSNIIEFQMRWHTYSRTDFDALPFFYRKAIEHGEREK